MKVPKKHQVIVLADRLSDEEHTTRMDRITNALRKRRENYFKEPTYNIVDMLGSREDDGAMDLLENNLTSLGMPSFDVLASIPEIPPLPSADAIIAASRDTDEVQKWIKNARIYARIDGEEK
jgi:hypothetical protein